jgi:hypothetical protein
VDEARDQRSFELHVGQGDAVTCVIFDLEGRMSETRESQQRKADGPLGKDEAGEIDVKLDLTLDRTIVAEPESINAPAHPHLGVVMQGPEQVSGNLVG